MIAMFGTQFLDYGVDDAGYVVGIVLFQGFGYDLGHKGGGEYILVFMADSKIEYDGQQWNDCC